MESKATHRHFMLNKPYGFVSQFVTSETKRVKRKKFLGELYDFPIGTMSVGRLDMDSEGLLFLTTDGKVCYHITGTQVEKEYYVQLDGMITDESLALIEQGLEISVQGKRYLTKPCKARRLEEAPILAERAKKIRDAKHGPTSWAAITINEGKYRQVRKMTAKVGFPTLRLVRVRIGNTLLGQLSPGEVVEVKSLV